MGFSSPCVGFGQCVEAEEGRELERPWGCTGPISTNRACSLDFECREKPSKGFKGRDCSVIWMFGSKALGCSWE